LKLKFDANQTPESDVCSTCRRRDRWLLPRGRTNGETNAWL